MSLTKVSFSMITGAVVNVKDYGAKGDGTTNDTLAIQAAIDACSTNGNGGGIVFVPSGIYLMCSRDYINSSGTTIGRCCLIMRDGVTLQGENWGSQLKLDASQYSVGTYFRLIASDTVSPLVQASIRDITINGNRSNNPSITDGNNILLEVTRNVVIDNVNSIASNGNGILLRGTAAAYMYNVEVTNCYSYSHAMIGIQCSQFNGLIIDNNLVSSTDNNCIDIYGDSGTPGGESHSLNFVISNNVCIGSTLNTGIFPETVSNGVIIGNTISSCDTGIHCNTINNQPRGVTIEGNNIVTVNYGIQITGATHGVRVINNYISAFVNYGVYLGTVNYTEVQNNYFIPPNSTTYCIYLTGTGSSYNRIWNNTVNDYIGGSITQAYLATDASTSGNDNFIGGFTTTPGLTGPDVASRTLQLKYAAASSTASPYDITIPNNTAGKVVVSVRYSTDAQVSTYPYVKYGGTLVVGTVSGTATKGSATITSATTSSGQQMRITCVNATGNYINAGLEYVVVT